MIVMVGKPYKPIYAEALRLAEKAAGHAVDRTRILAIGDSVRTDAIGAAGAGLDLLFITGSIHAAELDAFGNADPEAIRRLVDRVVPTSWASCQDWPDLLRRRYTGGAILQVPAQNPSCFRRRPSANRPKVY